jgi:hypothetical protein
MTAAPTGVIKDRSHQITNQPAPRELTSRVVQVADEGLSLKSLESP